MDATRQFLKDSGVFYVATTDADGAPQVRPFSAICEFEGKLYLCTNNQKDVYRQMKANPKVAISAMAHGKWIRLRATAAEDDRREARVAMIEAEPSLASMYSADDGLMTVFSLEGAADICSFTDEPEHHEF